MDSIWFVILFFGLSIIGVVIDTVYYNLHSVEIDKEEREFYELQQKEKELK